jgi:hypothetical protein
MKANMGSTISHSCDANCQSSIVSRNGKLSIALTTKRHVHYGEEITHDYHCITNSELEWRAAVCLCSMCECRGSFLHYATEEDLQQILEQNCGNTNIITNNTIKSNTNLLQDPFGDSHNYLKPVLRNH